MAEESTGRWALTPLRIASIYLLAGGIWIILSDQVVAAVLLRQETASQVQTIKGWVFVAASGLLIYGLTARSRRQLKATNRRLQRSVHHASVLHRILRHNVRNACNVIGLQTEMLAERAEDGAEPKRAIERQLDSLLELGEKSQELRDIVLGAQDRLPIDLAGIVEREVETLRRRHPTAVIEVDCPETVGVAVYPEIELAVRELLENAAEHCDGALRIAIDIRRAGQTVSVEIADEGPGLPRMERDVLLGDLEEPLQHSQGLGLWSVRVIVTESGGEVAVSDNDPSGTIVRMELPAADTSLLSGPGQSQQQTVYPSGTNE